MDRYKGSRQQQQELANQKEDLEKRLNETSQELQTCKTLVATLNQEKMNLMNQLSKETKVCHPALIVKRRVAINLLVKKGVKNVGSSHGCVGVGKHAGLLRQDLGNDYLLVITLPQPWRRSALFAVTVVMVLHVCKYVDTPVPNRGLPRDLVSVPTPTSSPCGPARWGKGGGGLWHGHLCAGSPLLQTGLPCPGQEHVEMSSVVSRAPEIAIACSLFFVV